MQHIQKVQKYYVSVTHTVHSQSTRQWDELNNARDLHGHHCMTSTTHGTDQTDDGMLWKVIPLFCKLYSKLSHCYWGVIT